MRVFTSRFGMIGAGFPVRLGRVRTFVASRSSDGLANVTGHGDVEVGGLMRSS